MSQALEQLCPLCLMESHNKAPLNLIVVDANKGMSSRKFTMPCFVAVCVYAPYNRRYAQHMTFGVILNTDIELSARKVSQQLLRNPAC